MGERTESTRVKKHRVKTDEAYDKELGTENVLNQGRVHVERLIKFKLLSDVPYNSVKKGHEVLIIDDRPEAQISVFQGGTRIGLIEQKDGAYLRSIGCGPTRPMAAKVESTNPAGIVRARLEN